MRERQKRRICDKARRREPGRKRLHAVATETAGHGFGHGRPAAVADADEQELEARHDGIVQLSKFGECGPARLTDSRLRDSLDNWRVAVRSGSHWLQHRHRVLRHCLSRPDRGQGASAILSWSRWSTPPVRFSTPDGLRTTISSQKRSTRERSPPSWSASTGRSSRRCEAGGVDRLTGHHRGLPAKTTRRSTARR